jgi:hypothetical protein
MPDTAANQLQWPQNSNQQPGCGFPQLKVVGLFCLQSGALLQWPTTTSTITRSSSHAVVGVGLARINHPKPFGFLVGNRVTVSLDQGPNVMAGILGGAVGGAKHLVMVRAKGFSQCILKARAPRPQASGHFACFQQIIHPLGVFSG